MERADENGADGALAKGDDFATVSQLTLVVCAYGLRDVILINPRVGSLSDPSSPWVEDYDLAAEA